jgi:pimeloyl-ACP methyl ester carboxylesterase
VPAAGHRVPPEQTRARYPDVAAVVERNGGRIAYEVYGSGDPTIMFVPPWTIVHSRIWKAQIPDFARRHGDRSGRRGNGCLIGRAIRDARRCPIAADLLPCSTTQTESAVLVGLSAQRSWPMAASEHPERVLAWPRSPVGPARSSERSESCFDAVEREDGWAKQTSTSGDGTSVATRVLLRGGVQRISPTKAIEDGVGYGTRPIRGRWATIDAPGRTPRPSEPLRRDPLPDAIAHATRTDLGRAAGWSCRAAPGAEFVLLRGSGHCPNLRDPIRINRCSAILIATDGSADARARASRAEVARGRRVRIAFETFGAATTLVFLPSAPIIHSRQWKGQVPYFGRHHRVVTYDGRGNGRSDRPTTAEAFADDRFVEDLGLVMDATDTDRAVLVGLCGDGVWRAIRLAAEHPERVLGIVAFAVGVPHLSPPHPFRVAFPFEEELATAEGWAKVNRHYWRRDYPGFAEFFFREITSEPHSTKAIEDAVDWAVEGSVESMLADAEAVFPYDRQEVEAICRRVACPMLIVHGANDHCQPVERAHRLAELTGARLVVVEDADHMIPGRHPVLANLLIRDFVQGLA